MQLEITQRRGRTQRDQKSQLLHGHCHSKPFFDLYPWALLISPEGYTFHSLPYSIQSGITKRARKVEAERLIMSTRLSPLHLHLLALATSSVWQKVEARHSKLRRKSVRSVCVCKYRFSRHTLQTVLQKVL